MYRNWSTKENALGKNMCSDVWIAVRYEQVGVVRMRVLHKRFALDVVTSVDCSEIWASGCGEDEGDA